MSRMKRALDVVQDLRTLADSIEALADAVCDSSTHDGELADVLTAIKVVAERLACKLSVLAEMEREAGEPDEQNASD